MSTSTLASVQSQQLQELPKQRTLLGDAARRFARNKLALLGLAMVSILLLTAIFADFIAPYPYDAANPATVPPAVHSGAVEEAAAQNRHRSGRSQGGRRRRGTSDGTDPDPRDRPG
jgi:ABC-type dipeptide/oligopeptide/nickel transport system permease subunit